MEQSRISSPAGAHSPAGTQAAGSKGAAGKSGSASDAAGAGDFLALLASLGDSALQQVPEAEEVEICAVPVQDAQSGEVTAADIASLVSWQGLVAADALPVPSVSPGLDTRPQGAGADLTAALGGAPSRGLAASDPLGGVPVDTLGLVGTSGGGLVAQTTALDLAGDTRNSGGLVPGVGGGAAKASQRAPSMLARIAEDAGGAGGSAAPRSAAVDTGLALGTTLQALAQSMVGVRDPQAAVAPRGESRMATEVFGGGVGADLGLAALSAGGDTQAGTSRDGGFASSPSDLGGGAAGVSEPAAQDGVLTFEEATAAATTPEERVAEQVTYWVNQKIQNAEMTLQADGLPVEVLVSLSGNEAHVTFRSDESQTRSLLDAGMAQLSDMLRGEGLVLSGMTVGTSGREGSGGQPGQPSERQGARQLRVAAADAPAGPAPVKASGRIAERSVDVFV